MVLFLFSQVEVIMNNLIDRLEQEKVEYVVKQAAIEDALEENPEISSRQRMLLNVQLHSLLTLITVLEARITDLREINNYK